MNKKLQDSYESIVDELSLEEVKFFKIGITNSLEEREEQYLSEGYSQVYPLATGNNANIIQAESDLIKELLSDNRVNSKCKNKSTVPGLGQTQSAGILYVAVYVQLGNPISSLDIHLKNILFASGFPIKL